MFTEEHAVTVLSRIYPTSFWVDSVVPGVVRALDTDGKLVMQLPLETVLSIFLDVGVLGESSEDYASGSWQALGVSCFGAQGLASTVSGYCS